MKSKIYLGQDDFSKLVAREVEGAATFRKLTKLLDKRMQGDLALAMQGELDEGTSEALEKFKRSLRDRAAEVSKQHKKLTGNIIDDALQLAALDLETDCPSDDEIAQATVSVYQETKLRLGEILVNKQDAKFTASKDSSTFEDLNEDEQADIIVAASKQAPAIPEPEDLFPNSGSQATRVIWHLRESLHQVHCEQETDEWGDDDIVFRGAYAFEGTTKPLNVSSAEKSFSTGSDHFYTHSRDAMGNIQAHAKVQLVDPGGYLPTFYLSSHVLTEADDLDAIAQALASFVEGVVKSPLSNALGAAAGQLGVTGAGVAGGVGGAILDEIVDSATSGMLSKAGANANRVIFNIFSGINASNNIIFQPWYTGVSVTWKSVIGSSHRQPRWKVRHSIGGKVWDAQPRTDNPKTGQGTLSPGRFAGDTEVILLPEIWKGRTQRSATPNGKYWYMSHIYVYREVFNPN